MPRTTRSVEPLESWEEEDSTAALLGRSSFVYVVFITFTVGLLSNASGPGWILMMLMSLLLLVGCLRLAAQDAAQHDSMVLHEPRIALSPMGSARSGGAAGTGGRGEGRAGSSGAAAGGSGGPLALLRSGRVVVLPPRQFGRHHQVPSREEDLEEGLMPAGHVRLLLAQLSQQLNSLRSRVQAGGGLPVSPGGGTVVGPPAPVPVSEEDLLSLPTRVYVKPPLSGGGAALDGGKPGSSVMATHSQAGRGPADADAAVSLGPSAGGASAASSSAFVCSICLEEAEEGVVLVTLPCLHQFHDACVKPWIARQGRHVACPLCKTPVFV